MRNLDLCVSIEQNGMRLSVPRELADVIARLFSARFAKLWILGRLEVGGGGATLPREVVESLSWEFF